MAKLSILALCYNHAAFLDEALASLQALPAGTEVLIADDASTDSSPEILRRWKEKRPDWTFILHEQNQGNCKTFNKLLSIASGEWIVDFATDDVLESSQVFNWITFAEMHPEAGFCYADAWIFSGSPESKRKFSDKLPAGDFPQGRILTRLFGKEFICPPAVLFSRKALLQIAGYDENLSYEDLDVWLRIAREFPVVRYPEPVIHYRQHPDSMSARLYQGRNRLHLLSTLQILNKVKTWPEFQPPPEVLIAFVRYHLRLCFFLQFKPEAAGFYELIHQSASASWMDTLFYDLSGKIPVMPKLYRLLQFVSG